MSSPSILREPTISVPLPANVPAKVILGQRGKIVTRLSNLTGAKIKYVPDDHRVDLRGRPKDVEAAARLVEHTVEHYLYSGQQFARKETLNILDRDLSAAETIQLVPTSRPIVTPFGPVDGFVLNPVGRQQPGASSSSSSPSAGGGVLRLAGDLEPALQQLIDIATTISLQHPADCDRAGLRLYLGKLALCDVATSTRSLPPEALARWTYPADARMVFDTALPQETIRALDRYLTSRGLSATQQVKSASLHLESSIPWIQYHPTFAVQPDGSLALSKLETLGCKPYTLALVGPANMADVRLRYVASIQHAEDDAVAAELRRRQGEFGLVNGAQVAVPSDLAALDLTLTSARVKLKRVYTSAGPLPPPALAGPGGAPAQGGSADSATAAARPPRTKRAATAAAAAAAAASSLPTVSLKVTVAAVLDNLGGKRLEVTVSCPEINEALLEVHRQRAEPPGLRERLGAQLRSLMAQVDDLRRNVEFVP